MKALKFEFLGDHPTCVMVPAPTPSPAELKVQVDFSALDTGLDMVLKKTDVGQYIHKFTDPLHLGWHYSGTVVEVGSKVTNNKEGDTVFGFLQYFPDQTQGTFCEYIVVKPDECAIYDPKKIKPEEAAAASTEYITALQALRDCGKLDLEAHRKTSQQCLVIGGGGGVGTAAVQLARHVFGAATSAICSKKDRQRVETAGADRVFVRDGMAVEDILVSLDMKFNCIFDTPSVCDPTFAKMHLVEMGHYVATLPKDPTVSIVNAESNREDLDLLSKWMMSDKIKIPIDSIVPIKDMASAILRQRQSDKKGRVVIQVSDAW